MTCISFPTTLCEYWLLIAYVLYTAPEQQTEAMHLNYGLSKTAKSQDTSQQNKGL